MKPSVHGTSASSDHSPQRRHALLTGGRWLAAGSGTLLLPLSYRAHAQAPNQKDWRYCAKCHGLFFDGYPDKGICKAGGGHAAAGYNFSLPHDTAETPHAQSNWRYCAKCHAMFFDGFPTKGVCPGGGAHSPAGYRFVLPHSMPETPVAQGFWRYCHKCQVMFFDGFPDKGICNAGGAHEAAGFVFVLAHDTDYPVKLQDLTRRGAPMQDVLRRMWDEGGRAIVGQRVEQAINGRRFAKGVSGRVAHARMATMHASVVQQAPTRFAIDLNVPGNNVEFKTTTPTVFGSYADPQFRVGFDMTMKFILGVANRNPPLIVEVLDARLSNAGIHGSNAVGTIVETVMDAVKGGGFSRSITDRINNDTSLRDGLGSAIAGAMDKVF